MTSAAAYVVRGDLYPGHEQWSSVELSQRADWWAHRIGTLIGAVAALPAITGAVPSWSRSPLSWDVRHSPCPFARSPEGPG